MRTIVIDRTTAIELTSFIVVATFHGYLAAWLAVRMLFRPRYPVKLLGITIWPQGMIPRHRQRLAEAIGRAVGEELVSQETITTALFETDFFHRKVGSLVTSYSDELLDKTYPSLLDALPSQVRAPVLDAIAGLQIHIAEYIANLLKGEETAEAVREFIDQRVDDLLAKRLGETLNEETFEQIIRFVEERFHNIVTEPGFASKVRDFSGARLEELAASRATLAEMFTPETVAIVKERIDSQLPPIVQHLAELATNPKTRTQLGALIKHEVDDYYNQLSFIKKIFVSRERIYKEVDDMVNQTLPRRVEEFLHGEAFEQEAESFLNSTIDRVLARPITELVGQIAPEKLMLIKDQVTARVLMIAQSPELRTSISAYVTDALARLRPHTLRALLEHANSDSAPRVKGLLTKGLLKVLGRRETARTINSILNTQVERLLLTPIGRPSDHLSAGAAKRASEALTERITEAARERLPAAITEFDIGGIVRRKVSDYPVEKLETLVLSVAQQHLRTIELFGLVIGFVIGVVQALMVLYMPSIIAFFNGR